MNPMVVIAWAMTAAFCIVLLTFAVALAWMIWEDIGE